MSSTRSLARCLIAVSLLLCVPLLVGCGNGRAPTTDARARKLMSSDKIDERVEGIRMLGSAAGGKGAIPELMDLLGSDDAKIRAVAAQSLTTLEAPDAADKFAKLLESETDAAAQYSYLQGIGTLKGEDAMVAACKPFLSSDESAKQQTATALLASALELGSAAVPVVELVALAGSSDTSIRANVASALGNTALSSPSFSAAKAALKKLLDDPEDDVKVAAQEALEAHEEQEQK